MTTTAATDRVTPFEWRVPQRKLDDLTARLRQARLPGVLGDGTDEVGFSTAAARDMLTYWREHFDWRQVEEKIATLDHVLVDVSHTTGRPGQRVHVVRATGKPVTAAAAPIVLLHGWPDSFLRFRHLLAPLTAAGHDVYVPSLPGSGFSEQVPGPATVAAAAGAIAAALVELGVTRYAVHGGDWGSAVAEALAIDHPDVVTAVHLQDVPWRHYFAADRTDATPAESAFYETADAWADQAAYVAVQSTQTTTLALALADSPLGLAAWWAEKYLAWTDTPVGWDEILTQVCLTWFTRTEHSGMRWYSGLTESDEEVEWSSESTWTAAVRQPVAVAIFPADIHVPPREYAARAFPTLQRFTIMPEGGHFAALEHPDQLAADIAAFLADLG
ncbi:MULTISPECIES: epoxide hydrolase family protein [Nocardiaceae]|uniref:Epoxide hydrolase n=1 Tax=Rhodococcoides kroppenstedtii TaxID=293050 RepID=A0ABS7NVQ4_9NOCA|nr:MULTISPECIES: epoxide hydrolase family protein [Rhodococcus]MBY6313519.1 epoxide hydrolase [Rhodococcus kroppenstedtii]MBY6321475.1 epoxide hydrolase [Rhodococcus kroppenstedtii]MBY6400173.1 epoxide hydrolase [Rhodococcus kroppenstedtii]